MGQAFVTRFFIFKIKRAQTSHSILNARTTLKGRTFKITNRIFSSFKLSKLEGVFFVQLPACEFFLK
jgi:hypothetical protein